MNVLTKILVAIGSSASIGFGIWHFFVPQTWKWFSYIDPKATELIVAVRAINVFFSLVLVLFGLLNIIFVFSSQSNRYSIIVMLIATCILWLTRVAYQAIYPQGTLYPGLRYGMLVAFVLITICYAGALCAVISQKSAL
jgi:hypothetical protein